MAKSGRQYTAEEKARWAVVLRDCQCKAAMCSGAAARVLLALQKYVQPDGYAWPSVYSIVEDTKLSRNAVFEGLNELKQERIIDRRQLISRTKGHDAPALVRIGWPIEKVPDRATAHFVLAGSSEAEKIRSTWKVKKPDPRVDTPVQENSTGGIPQKETGGVAENGTRPDAKTGTQNYSNDEQRNRNEQEEVSERRRYHHQSSSNYPPSIPEDEDTPPQASASLDRSNNQYRRLEGFKSEAKHRLRNKLPQHSDADLNALIERILGRSKVRINSASYIVESVVREVDESDEVLHEDSGEESVESAVVTEEVDEDRSKEDEPRTATEFEKTLDAFSAALEKSESITSEDAKNIVGPVLNEKGLFVSWDAFLQLSKRLRYQCFNERLQRHNVEASPKFPGTVFEAVELLIFDGYGEWPAMNKACSYLFSLGNFSKPKSRMRFEKSLLKIRSQKATYDANRAKRGRAKNGNYAKKG